MARPQSLEDQFEKIAQDAIRAAEEVKCELSEFAAGLRDIESSIRERRELADDEVRHKDGEDEA